MSGTDIESRILNVQKSGVELERMRKRCRAKPGGETESDKYRYWSERIELQDEMNAIKKDYPGIPDPPELPLSKQQERNIRTRRFLDKLCAAENLDQQICVFKRYGPGADESVVMEAFEPLRQGMIQMAGTIMEKESKP